MSLSEIWVSDIGVYEAYCLVGCDTLLYGRSLPTSWRNILPPSLGSKVKHAASRVGVFCFLAYLAYSSTLKMEIIPYSETSVNFFQTACHHTPEDNILHGIILSLDSTLAGGLWSHCSRVPGLPE
jgi:hypothetical protein